MGASPVGHGGVTRHVLPAGPAVPEIHELRLRRAAQHDPRSKTIGRHQRQQHRRTIEAEVRRVGQRREVVGCAALRIDADVLDMPADIRCDEEMSIIEQVHPGKQDRIARYRADFRQHCPAVVAGVVALRRVVAMPRVGSRRMALEREYLAVAQGAERRVPPPAACVLAGLGSHVGHDDEDAARRHIDRAMPMAIEVVQVVWPGCIGRKLRGSAGHQQASIAQKRMAAAEQVEVRQVCGYQRLGGTTTVEPGAMIEIVRVGRRKVVIVATEENDFAVAVRGRHQCSMDGDHVGG